MSRQSIGKEMAIEAHRAASNFARFHSHHEALGVIREEYVELEREIFRKQSEYDGEQMRKEAIHLGAMALRLIYDLIDGHYPDPLHQGGD